MKRFEKILLVCDENSVHDAAVARAVWLAKANDATVTLVYVVDSAPGELARLFGALPGARAHEVEYEVLQFHRSRLAELALPIRDTGVATRECLLQGIPFVEIIKLVLRERHDLVIKAAGGDKEGKSLFFASTDLHLMRKCPCPVWIMKRSAREPYARVLAAVDPDPADQQTSTLNTLILDLATSLSKMDHGELHVVHAWRLDEEKTLRDSAFARIPPQSVDLLVEGKRRDSEAKLDQLLSGYRKNGEDWNVHLIKGAAREAIPALAEDEQIELIVMGTVGRTGVKGLIIGNTAEAILNQVECSVLAVKPPGFVSPVQLDAPSEAVAEVVSDARGEAA